MESEHLPSLGLDGQVAHVTGASRGIGEGLCEALAVAGATVAVTARRMEDAEAVAASIVAAGGVATAHTLDVTDVASVGAAVDEVVAAHGRLDVLVANAGLGDNLSALEVTEDHWDSMMNVNLKG
jgi:NAD(P)-dependent dehydrogenase (short-subunit alcohol dehydrogenase family)